MKNKIDNIEIIQGVHYFDYLRYSLPCSKPLIMGIRQFEPIWEKGHFLLNLYVNSYVIPKNRKVKNPCKAP